MSWHEALAGKFIVLDGGECCGKTTVIDRLEGELEQAGVPVLRVREPGGTVYGEQIRNLLLNFVCDPPEELHPLTEVFLFAAARAQLLNLKILPALRDGFCVLTDRFVTSTFAYQGAAGGIETKQIMEVAKATIPAGQWPWFTVILDVTHETAMVRMQDRGEATNRIESQGDAYHRKVRQGFRDLPDILGDVHVMDASGDPEQVFEAVCEKIRAQLK